MRDRSILGSYQDDFLQHYWQKKPLLIRQAIPGGLHYIDGDELAGFAGQESVEARLVINHGANKWETRFGPFEDAIWSSLPDRSWSLLVQAVDRLLPEVSRLRDRFRFLPNWRVDDIMISYAVDQGGVGPHTDHYDVFLIQGQGRRRWEIGGEALHNPELIADLEMKILKSFEPVQSFDLEPGDMLYLPPGFAHNGVALGESITYSVGFRAPHQKELMLSFLQFCSQNMGEENFYQDDKLHADREPGLILPEEISRLRQLMLNGIADQDLFLKWLGGFLTEPRSFHEQPEQEYSAESILKGLRQGRSVCRAEGGRFAYYPVGNRLHFAVEGECLLVDSALTEVVALLCREQEWNGALLLAYADQLGYMELLCHLWNQSYLRWTDQS